MLSCHKNLKRIGLTNYFKLCKLPQYFNEVLGTGNETSIIKKCINNNPLPPIPVIYSEPAPTDSPSFKVKTFFDVNLDALMGISHIQSNKNQSNNLRNIIYNSIFEPGKKLKTGETIHSFNNNNLVLEDKPKGEETFQLIKKTIKNAINERVKISRNKTRINEYKEQSINEEKFYTEFKNSHLAYIKKYPMIVENNVNIYETIEAQAQFLSKNIFNTEVIFDLKTIDEYNKRNSELSVLITQGASESVFSKFIANVFCVPDSPEMNQALMNQILESSNPFSSILTTMKRIPHQLNTPSLGALVKYLDHTTNNIDNSQFLNDITIASLENETLLSDKSFIKALQSINVKMRDFENIDLFLFVAARNEEKIEILEKSGYFTTQEPSKILQNFYTMPINLNDIPQFNGFGQFAFNSKNEIHVKDSVKNIQYALMYTGFQQASIEHTPFENLKVKKITLNEDTFEPDEIAKGILHINGKINLNLGNLYNKNLFQRLEEYMPDISSFIFQEIDKMDSDQVQRMNYLQLCTKADIAIKQKELNKILVKSDLLESKESNTNEGAEGNLFKI